MARFSGPKLRRHGGAWPVLLLLAAVHLCGSPAAAQDGGRWVAGESGARAVLPPPRSATGISGAALSCMAQRWRLEIVTDRAPDDPAASMEVDGRVFALRKLPDTQGPAFAVPRAALGPLGNGLRLKLLLPSGTGAAPDEAIFSLRGSKLAIAAVQDRCTPRDMSAYTPVTFTPYSSYIRLGRDLRQDDINAFRLSTASEPQLDVAMAEFDGGRRVLFTRLCGSSWYYGASGCNITGHAPDGDDGWKTVYDTENVHLHTDPAALTDGWPDLVTLPARREGGQAAGAGLIWRWDGRRYALKGELPDEPEERPGAAAAAQ